jgi:hypothetical protein
MLVLLMRRIYKIRRLDRFRGNKTRTNFHKDRFRHSKVVSGWEYTCRHTDELQTYVLSFQNIGVRIRKINP